MISERTIYHAKQMGEANWRAKPVVEYALKKDSFAAPLFEVGFSADPPEFMKSLDKRVEKLTVHKQKLFFKNLATIFEKKNTYFFNTLKDRASYLTNYKSKGEELDKFSYFTKRLTVLAKQNGVDLKRFFVK